MVVHSFLVFHLSQFFQRLEFILQDRSPFFTQAMLLSDYRSEFSSLISFLLEFSQYGEKITALTPLFLSLFERLRLPMDATQAHQHSCVCCSRGETVLFLFFSSCFLHLSWRGAVAFMLHILAVYCTGDEAIVNG